ncbi:hypothetical protein ACQ4PT_068237 [Festuca glaucescens]
MEGEFSPPEDVLADILGRLSHRDLALSRQVCSSWRAVVDTRRLLLRHALPHSVRGLFLNYRHHGQHHFFARPTSTGPRINGELTFLPFRRGECTIHDHRNGLILLYSERGSGGWYVANPATRRWACLPPAEWRWRCAFDPYLVFEPAVSPHYEVCLVPSERCWRAWNDGLDEAAEAVVKEWPPSACVLQVLSSKTGRWEKRTFVREEPSQPRLFDAHENPTKINLPVEPIDDEWELVDQRDGGGRGSIALAPAPDPDDLFRDFSARCPPGEEEVVVLYTTKLRGVRKMFEDCNAVRALFEPPARRLFVHDRYIGGSVVAWQLYPPRWSHSTTTAAGFPSTSCHRMILRRRRLSFTENKYQIIKTPTSIEDHCGPQCCLGNSKNGVYYAAIYHNNNLKVWILEESSGQAKWVLKHDINLESTALNALSNYSNENDERWSYVFDGAWNLEDGKDDENCHNESLEIDSIDEEKDDKLSDDDFSAKDDTDKVQVVGLLYEESNNDEVHQDDQTFEQDNNGSLYVNTSEEENTNSEIVGSNIDWNSDDDDVLSVVDEKDEDDRYLGYYLILGFHPYKEVVFLAQFSRKGVAYHLNTSKVQYLGTVRARYTESIEKSFVYTPSMIGELPESSSSG